MARASRKAIAHGQPPASEDLLAQTEVRAAPPVESAPSRSAALPSLLEYRPISEEELWRVEKFELFAAEFGFVAGGSPSPQPSPPGEGEDGGGLVLLMAMFHEVSAAQPHGWLICRRLFGIGPLIPSPDADPETLRPLERAEICAQLGLNRDQLQAALDVLRTRWREHQKRQEPDRLKAELQTPPPLKETLAFGDDVLREFGFEERMFEVMVFNDRINQAEARDKESNRIERDWFCSRVAGWAKMLREPIAGALAREALMNELFLKRFSQEMAPLSPGTKRWNELYTNKKQTEQIFQEQIKELQNMFPELQTKDNVGFTRVLSDLNKAHRDYYGHADKRLLDKINTSNEIEILLRTSVQQPEPRYRLGLEVYIIEAMHNLYDPNFRSQLKHSVLKKLDEGFREAVKRKSEALGEQLVDLEKGVLPGEGDDFPDLKEPEEPTNEKEK